MSSCLGDSLINGALGVAGGVDPSGITGMISLTVDLLGGGINPLGDATGTSSYFSVNDTGYGTPSLTSMGSAGVTVAGLAAANNTGINRMARQSVTNSAGSGFMRNLFGRGNGQALMGNLFSKSPGVLGKAIPLVGIGFGIKGGRDFYKSCEARCEKFK